MEHRLSFNRVGFLTAGSGSPGVNAALFTLNKLLSAKNIEVLGFKNGLAGVLNKDFETSLEKINPILGGSSLGFGTLKDIVHTDIRKKIADNVKELKLDCLIVLGGDSTLKTMALLAHENGVDSLILPATVENDVPGVERALGFDTAVSSGVSFVDKIIRTENPMNSLVIVEVLGKNWGLAAIEIGLACGVDDVFVPEVPFNLDDVVSSIRNKQKNINRPIVFLVGEGQKSGRANDLAEQLRKKLSLNIKVCGISEIQKSGEPSGNDRILAIKYSVKVVEFLFSGKLNSLVSFQNHRFIALPFQDLGKVQKKTPSGLLKLLKELNQ